MYFGKQTRQISSKQDRRRKCHQFTALLVVSGSLLSIFTFCLWLDSMVQPVKELAMSLKTGIISILTFSLLAIGCGGSTSAPPNPDAGGGMDGLVDDQQVVDTGIVPDQMTPDFKVNPDQTPPDFKVAQDQMIPDLKVTQDQMTPDNSVVNPVISATVTTTTPSSILVSGHVGSLLFGPHTTYKVTGTSKSNMLKALIIINDLQGAFDKPEDTNVVKSLSVVCSPKGGTATTFIGTLVAGKYVFQGMNCYDTMGKGLEVRIYFSLNYITGGTFTLSGKKLRLGILESSMKVGGQSKIGTFIVRKSKPVFTTGVQSSANMNAGSNVIYRFGVTANGGDVGFARLVFKLNTKGLNDNKANILNFSFHGQSGLVSNHHIWGQAITGKPAAVYLKGTGSLGLQNADITSITGVNDGAYYIVVTFDNEVIVAKGNTATFTLYAFIVGATTNDTLVSGLMGDDEFNEVIVGSLYDNDNGFNNTSTLVGHYSKAGDSLFDGSAGSGTSNNEFFGDTVVDWVKYRNVVWSDHSGGVYAFGVDGAGVSWVHSYPNMKGSSIANKGYIVGASGTFDWTNGYRLGFKLIPFMLKQ